MSHKLKTFNCVEMKNRIQAERMAEYESRKNEFSSYSDCINARVKESGLALDIPNNMIEYIDSNRKS